MTLLAAETADARVAVIIVTYNSEATLGDLLHSLEASTIGVRTIVVDNGSSDDTLQVATAFPQVMTIATRANLGYSGGINIGRTLLRPSEDVAVLNPDLVLARDALERMLRVLDGDPAVGIVAPQLRDLGTGQRFDSLRREPSVSRAAGDSLFGSRWRSRPAWMGETLRTEGDYSEPSDVAWAGGAALLVSAECNRAVGPWDSDTYFLYSEETDYARRARDLGFRVRYEPSAVALHAGSGSGQPAPLVALISVNRIRYFARLHGRVRTGLFRIAVSTQHLLRLHDPRHRYALPVVLRTSRWGQLPAAEPAPPHLGLASDRAEHDSRAS